MNFPRYDLKALPMSIQNIAEAPVKPKGITKTCSIQTLFEKLYQYLPCVSEPDGNPKRRSVLNT